MYHISQIKIVSALVFCVLFFVAMPVFAANIFFHTKNQSLTKGEEFSVDVFLNTEEESLNAVEGKIIFPVDLLEMREIRDGNSAINFWIEKPGILQSGVIAFSGITPGGLLSQKELLFSIVFRAEKEGSGTILLDGLQVLRNDGKGTPASVAISPLRFSISQEGSVVQPIAEPAKDIAPPESFVPEIASDPNIFDGKLFLVFATQDKGSGIDHYEVKETRQRFFEIFSKWISAESPSVLRDQELRSYISVKAIDKAGNEKIERILPRNPLLWYENYENWIIIVLGLVIAYAIYIVTRSKRHGTRK